ncbi:MAG: carbohydrate binding domain-containing protein, partial [Anaerolineae bacterium]|nr:carbohydrate binding domain-containing protein [Anaerolineae bacterium]
MKNRMAFSVIVAILLLVVLSLLASEGSIVAARPAVSYRLVTADGLSLTLSADGQVQSLTVNGAELPITPGPVLWLRDMSHAGEVTTPNLLSNPGFEQELTGWHITQQKDVDIGVTGSHAHSGGRALELVGTGDQGLGVAALATTAPIPVTPGKRYRVSGYFLSSRGYVQGVSGTPPVRQEQMWRGLLRPNGLYVRWRDASGQQMGDVTLVASLHWNDRDWRKIGGEVRAPDGAAGMDVIIGGRLKDETLWVDDLDVVASPETETPVTGNVVPCESDPSNCLLQVATLPGSGLVLTATYTAMADHIGVHVAVRDTTGADRALEVVWGLPLNLTSGNPDWRWWDDVRHSRTIRSGDVASPSPEHPFPAGLSWAYEHVVSGVWDGWLPISLYPYSLVEDGNHGLAMATPLNSPRLIKLAYDQGEKRYEARSYLGISPQATKVGPVADFSLELFRVDPTWGFRAVMDAFARRHPAWFTPPHDMSGFVGYERGDYASPEGAQRALENDGKGIFTAEYIVADAPLDVAPSSDPMPTYTQTVALVHDMLQSPKMSLRLKAQAITHSVALASNGDWQIKHVGEFEWAQGKWQIVWYTSVDPDIADGWGAFQWSWNINRAISATEAVGAVLDGVMMDNFLTVPGVDLDPAHLALTDAPLAYDVSTYRPGVHNMVNIDEFFAWLRQRLHQRGRDDMAITINFWGVGTPNPLAPWIDAFGGEGATRGESTTNWNSHILDYRRAIAYHKPQSWTNGEKGLTTSEAEAYVARALFYGIFPTRKETATGWEIGAEEVLAQAQRLRSMYAPAKWEPLTYYLIRLILITLPSWGKLRSS